ncbi:MAG: outer membrane lipoprotein carrier protein LolA [Candidatus Adiutrix sp.]|jgi:outer membrane lipoprotein-sorting protein|nr:outer membrane lipoprotein carrier protein LolA [Candidatus Adiutrix sp.]
MKIRFFLILTLASLLLTAAPAGADQSAARRRLISLSAALADVQSINGQFTQEKKFDFLKEPVISRGVFFFSRPDYLHWEYLAPGVSGLDLEGGRVRAWTGPPEKRLPQPEAMAEAARLAAGQVLAWMNLDPEAIEAAYQVTVAGEEPLRLEVIPKRAGARKFIEALEVEFNADLRTVRQVTLREPESRTTLTFSAVRLNQPRPAD